MADRIVSDAMKGRPATVEELRAAFEASTFGRSMSFYESCTRPWSRRALELGVLILRAPKPTHIDITEPAPSRYAAQE